ncbi:HD domain-containing phosphohydrolase [Pseudomonas sp. PAMC 25886]|uniref:HD domain-containing phosphohydrolase n=1 Tax=Pseudomonas sp. PAMC 25886 TaxID=1125977 RepID=UPI000287C0BC|nr:HD domain-containing phosphohydrolase [Pseudomonas sp. PAMC 25886]
MPSRRVPLYVHISYLFVGLLLLFALINLSYQFLQTKRFMADEARSRFEIAGQLTLKELQSLYGPAELTVGLLSQQRLMSATTLDARLDSLPFLVTMLKAQPAVRGVYMGYGNGDFFMLFRGNENPTQDPTLAPPPGTAWTLQNIQAQGGRPVGEYLYLNADLSVMERRPDPTTQFDPRTRSWYTGAKSAGALFVTPPYPFFGTEEVGVSFAQPTQNGAGVAGIDISLHSIDQLLLSTKITPGSHLTVLNTKNEVISSEKGSRLIATGKGENRLAHLDELSLPVTRQFVAAATAQRSDQLSLSTADGEWQGMRVELPLAGTQNLSLWMTTPYRELMASAIATRNHGLFISLAFLAVSILVALAMSRAASRPLAALTRQATQIEQFNFEASAPVKSNIAEVIDLAHAMDSMKSTIQHFLELSRVLSSETNFQNLLARLLMEMQGTTGAKGGLIYLADANASHLKVARVRWGNELQETAGDKPVELDDNPSHPLVRALNTPQAKPERLSREQLQTHFGFLGDIQTSLTLWALPLKDRSGLLLGALVLLVDENERRLTPSLMAFVEALSSTAAIALNTQHLIDEQKTLLESFIQLIAGAIDAKSPYTGGHCQRVPELTKMLAHAACNEKDGPLKDFALNEEQWEALHIAAWLHDCGKVTTPEYVVDKATKLETLYDRIHEVRMRFEVLKRDAELDYWKGIAAGSAAETLHTELTEKLAQLDDDFAFVAQSNIGGEFMAPDRVERMQKLATCTWRRTLSDRIGISNDETARKQRSAEAALPVMEPLLADRPDHLFPRSSRDTLGDDNPYGFKVKVPEHLYNRGELYNLCIGRGTLTEEERYKINEHIIQTISMLEKLPFPRHLQDVPEIAGGHHEKMDGNGYPKRLTREQMSWPARMMGIADIFEALTAADRPYKKGKTLSEAIKIMVGMKKDQHIDPEIFDLFLRSGIYLEYARRYLPDELIDAVDIQPYLDVNRTEDA